MNYILWILFYELYSMHYILCNVYTALYSALCSMHCKKKAVKLGATGQQT
jgi:hypothetical protein